MIVCYYCTFKAVRFALCDSDEEFIGVCQQHYDQLAGGSPAPPPVVDAP